MNKPGRADVPSAVIRTMTVVIAVTALAVSALSPAASHGDHEQRRTGSASTATASASSPYNEVTHYRWQNPRTICVESRLGNGWTSQVAAVAELNTLDGMRFIHRSGSGGCSGWAKRIILTTIHDAGSKHRAWVDWGASAPKAWAKGQDGKWGYMLRSPVVIRLNTAVTGRTWQQNKMTWLHEMGHAIMNPIGPEWRGHTSRCDSIMSDSWSCIHAQTGLTKYDRATIARIYAPWNP